MGNALRNLVYLTTSNVHAKIQDSPFGELMGRERGMDMEDHVPYERWAYGADKTIMFQ